MSDDEVTCSCDGNVKLVFPCSGAADVGEISDRAARNLTSKTIGRYFVLPVLEEISVV